MSLVELLMMLPSLLVGIAWFFGSRCAYCKKKILFWQKHPLPSLHHACLELYCLGYAKGIETAALQARKIIDTMQDKPSDSMTH